MRCRRKGDVEHASAIPSELRIAPPSTTPGVPRRRNPPPEVPERHAELPSNPLTPRCLYRGTQAWIPRRAASSGPQGPSHQTERPDEETRPCRAATRARSRRRPERCRATRRRSGTGRHVRSKSSGRSAESIQRVAVLRSLTKSRHLARSTCGRPVQSALMVECVSRAAVVS
jgi:hypothetical protein